MRLRTYMCVFLYMYIWKEQERVRECVQSLRKYSWIQPRTVCCLLSSLSFPRVVPLVFLHGLHKRPVVPAVVRERVPAHTGIDVGMQSVMYHSMPRQSVQVTLITLHYSRNLCIEADATQYSMYL